MNAKAHTTMPAGAARPRAPAAPPRIEGYAPGLNDELPPQKARPFVKLPEPPPMRHVSQDGSTVFGFYLAMCVMCITVGIMIGLKMAGKV